MCSSLFISSYINMHVLRYDMKQSEIDLGFNSLQLATFPTTDM
jgi:hypothetical protein